MCVEANEFEFNSGFKELWEDRKIDIYYCVTLFFFFFFLLGTGAFFLQVHRCLMITWVLWTNRLSILTFMLETITIRSTHSTSSATLIWIHNEAAVEDILQLFSIHVASKSFILKNYTHLNFSSLHTEFPLSLFLSLNLTNHLSSWLAFSHDE